LRIDVVFLSKTVLLKVFLSAVSSEAAPSLFLEFTFVRAVVFDSLFLIFVLFDCSFFICEGNRFGYFLSLSPSLISFDSSSASARSVFFSSVLQGGLLPFSDVGVFLFFFYKPAPPASAISCPDSFCPFHPRSTHLECHLSFFPLSAASLPISVLTCK